MKIHKAITLSLLISVFFILCLNVNYFIGPIKDTQLQNDNVYQKELIDYEELSLESPQSSATLDSKDAYAIVVGISDYPGTTSDLSYCDDDSQDIYSMLINDFNFKPENVHYLQDSSASKGAISDAFDQIASEISEDDIFFFSYSGHGGAGTSSSGIQSYSIDSPHPYPNYYDNMWSIYRSDAAYMRVHFDHFDVEYDYDYVLLGDTDLASGWYYEGYTGYSTGFWSGWIPLLSDNSLYIRLISDSSITEWGFSIDSYEAEMYDGTHFLCSYDSIPITPSNYYMDDLLDSKLDLLNCAEKYVVLDSCNSGGMIPEVQEIGRYIMTACQDDEYSLESPSLQHGVFTNFFLNSFDSATDSNADGVISMEESYTYTSSNSISYSSGLGYTQHPQQYDGISGESVLFTAFGALNLTLTGNSLSYSFYLYGTGLIVDLRIAAYNISETITYSVEDLTENPASNTGFGYYSGTIQLNGVTGITGYGIFARIRGNDVIFLNQTVSDDTDSDLIDDITEIMFGMNPSNPDSDADGLDDYTEFYGVTNPNLYDTDSDELSDGSEVLYYLTDPLNPDTDGDGYMDGIEVAWGVDPLDPKISPNTVILNFLGIAIIAISGFFITWTTIASKNQAKKSIKVKKALRFDKEADTYNAVKVEKKFKPKPKPTYPTYTQRPAYTRPIYEQKVTFDNTSMDKIREIILYRLPPAKSPYSVEGKRALNVANNALQQINRGDVLTGTQNIIEALMLGVPEPMNSRFKATLLESIARMKSQVGVRPSIPTTTISREQPIKKPESQVSSNILYCTSCGQQNNASYKFCKNCGVKF